MMTDHDTIARMAIRLARGYRQGWAVRIPKSHGVAWDWRTASEYAQGARSAPQFDRAVGSITYATNKMKWTLDVAGDIEVEIETQTGQPCSVEATAFADASGAPVPAIIVRVACFESLCAHDLWKLDVAATALACGAWKPLHNLPPLRVLADVLRLPTTPCALVFVGEEVQARAPGDLSQQHPFGELLAEFGRQGGFRRWERLIVRRPMTASRPQTQKEGV